MLRNKGKGQGLVEFALILPVLLLLLLGIIESARVIWGYMSVQTAVREAARYAVTGKPYVTDSDSPFCFDPQGDPNALTPWICDPYSRTVAIEAVAMNRITTTLPYATLCNSDTYNLCQSVPNAFGVRVVGQYTDPLTPSVVITGVRHSGTQGLNVKITAFYNVQMIDPIFDAIMGGSFIPVRGEISMQNEGIDKVLGGVPPPAIGNTSSISGSTGIGSGPNGEEIFAGNYRVPQLGNLPVSLRSHFNLAGPYDIYLSGGSPALTFKICNGINTDPVTNNGDFVCFISGTIPPGFYTLYSTLGGDENPLATDLAQQVEIYTSNIAQIQVDNGAGGNIAAVNSDVTITLISHQVPDQNFDLYLIYGANPPQLIIPNVTAVPGPLTWHVPVTLTNPTNLCPVGGGTPCLIQSRRVVSPTQVYASGEFYLNQPEIVIQGGLRTFAQNEMIHITLRGHSPGLEYDLKISDGGANTVWQGRTLAADAIGEVKTPVNWAVPPTWPDGNYTMSSHPAVGTPPRNPASMTSANQVASLAVQVSTPSGAFITIDGGYTWPAGSVINIQANKHNQANNPYYFKFGSWRVPIPTSSPVDTFNADASQIFVAPYRIPLTATIGVTTTFAVSSFVNTTNSFVAQRNVTVLSVPVITVLEGSVVSPDTIITAKIINHVPDSTYRIFYLDKLLGEILTNATGQGQLQYDLRNLPINSPPGLSTSFGTPYPVSSQFLLTGAGVATTSLTLRASDLRVTNIQIPPNPALNTSVPVTFTIQNTSPVTITRYFDTDLYLDPSPLVPAYQGIGQFNFPGDFKYWRNLVAPNATFTIVQPFFIGAYGPHRLYSYADTSDRIFNETSELNNILSNTLTISCTPPLITDTFSALSATWATQLYGNADNNGNNPAIVSSQLRLTSDGSSTLGSNDSALSPVRGYTFFRKTTPITTAGGLDVRVQVVAAPNTVNGAKAGLELRDTLLPTSPKLEFGLTRSGLNQYRLQVVLRDSVSLAPVATYNSATLGLATPIWLRIQRYGGTNTFLFYYAQSAAAPASWGTPVHTMTVGLSNQLEYGLFVNNATSGSHQTATFDNFVVGNPASCLAAQGQPPINNAPPGLATCTDPLSEKGFETVPTLKWLGVGTGGVLPTTSSHTGNQALLADTLRPGPNNPVFYQRFAMPPVLISTTTTVELELFRNVEQETDGPDANDRFWVVLAISPTLASAVTNPVLVSSGDLGALGYDPSKWQQVNVTLPPALGVNLANYAGQNLYLYFYNNTNQTTSGCPPLNCHNTSFYFDDIKVEPCTVQPLPPVITTRIKGELVLHPSAGSAQKKAGVEVWAYAEGGQLYKTVTIQNGEFNFYNLPATTTGIRYFIYSEHFITSSLDPTQIEALTANASVVLTNANNDANPVITRLDLY